MASFGLYNALIGHLLLHREVPGLLSLAFFTVAMALHFLVTDIGLQEDHKQRYVTVGRWLLIVALGAGGVILNVSKEEVPAERGSRFWAFTPGMAAYAILLLTL